MPLIYGMTHWTKAELQIKKREPAIAGPLRAVFSWRRSPQQHSGELPPSSLGSFDFLQEFVEFYRLNLEWFFLHLDLGLNDRRVVVVLRSAVDVADDVELLVVTELLASESGVRQLNTVKGTVLAVRDIDEGRSSFCLQRDEHLVSQLLTAHMSELIKKTCCRPAVKATAVDICRPV